MSSDSGESSLEEEQHNLLGDMEARAEHQKVKHYRTLYSFTTSIGVGLLILLFFWLIHFRGGFAWQASPALEFNWHPFLMVLGMVFLYSQAILTYRSFRNFTKKRLKLVHASLHLLAFILSVIGLKAAFDSHNLAEKPVPNLYTFHSWLGLLTIILFSAQFLYGFIAFLFPGLATSIRKSSLPVHIAVGTAGFFMAIITTCMGITEKALWSMKTNYQVLPHEGILVNVMGLFVVLYGVMVLYLVHEEDYKRVSLPEDEIALTESE